MHNKPTKRVFAAKNAANTGLASRCSARRLLGRYVVRIFSKKFAGNLAHYFGIGQNQH
jgi:hypothetical protein